ncbi:MAG: DNA repair protein RecO, partial [Pyrinomonadaceae bacterium]|nr:DNA repair protein RecO [Pyrinomonadaceae bacterium]
NRFGAALEPFTLLQITYYQKENQDLVSLRQVEILKSHFHLSSDAETLTGLAYMADLVIEFSPPHQANERLFRMVKACLGAVDASPRDLQTVLRYFEIWLLKLEGFLPDIKRCAECHLPFAEERIAFVGPDLVLRCRSCSQGMGTALSDKLHRQLRASQKLAPCVFAQESRAVPAETFRELAELTHSLLGRVLERQPRVRSTFP